MKCNAYLEEYLTRRLVSKSFSVSIVNDWLIAQQKEKLVASTLPLGKRETEGTSNPTSHESIDIVFVLSPMGLNLTLQFSLNLFFWSLNELRLHKKINSYFDKNK